MSIFYPDLPRLPLVDLGSDYMAYLDEIDTQNRSRHYCGEPLLDYPSFDDFVALCRDASFDKGPKFSRLMHDLVSLKMPAESDEDFGSVAAVFPLPTFGAFSFDEEYGDADAPTEAPWDTSFGSFVFASSSKH